MDFYIAFTDKQLDKIDKWKKSLPKNDNRLISISFINVDERNEDKRLLFKAIMKTNDGYKLLITKKAIMH